MIVALMLQSSLFIYILRWLNDLLSSFNERFNLNSDILTSLSCLLLSKVCSSIFDGLYKEDSN